MPFYNSFFYSHSYKTILDHRPRVRYPFNKKLTCLIIVNICSDGSRGKGLYAIQTPFRGMPTRDRVVNCRISFSFCLLFSNRSAEKETITTAMHFPPFSFSLSLFLVHTVFLSLASLGVRLTNPSGLELM